VDYNRLNQIVAVLERRIGLDFSKQDVYVNVVGGLRIDEPAADLAMAMAMVTAHRNISVKPFTVFAGEIGLTGEIRPVSHGETRCREAAKMGFHHMVIPASVKSPDAESSDPLTIQRLSVSTVMDALAVGLGGAVSADSPADEPARLSR
jgi:DNA repair protein RadA/Sms